jgi:hypothetical protein
MIKLPDPADDRSFARSLNRAGCRSPSAWPRPHAAVTALIGFNALVLAVGIMANLGFGEIGHDTVPTPPRAADPPPACHAARATSPWWKQSGGDSGFGTYHQRMARNPPNDDVGDRDLTASAPIRSAARIPGHGRRTAAGARRSGPAISGRNLFQVALHQTGGGRRVASGL